jgi:predicted transcriptional regulator
MNSHDPMKDAQLKIAAVLQAFDWTDQRIIVRSLLTLIPEYQDEEAVRAIIGEETFTVDVLAKKLGIKHTAACNRIVRLERIGIAHRVKKDGRNVVWRIVADPDYLRRNLAQHDREACTLIPLATEQSKRAK